MLNIGVLTFSTIIGIPLGLYIKSNLNISYRKINRIKKDFEEIFRDKNLKSSKGKIPKIIDVNLYEYGFKVSVNIKKVCSYNALESLQDYIAASFSAKEIIITNRYTVMEIEVINNPTLDLDFKLVPLNQDKIVVGFNCKGEYIITDLKHSSGLLINGVPGTGKSVLLRQILNTLKFNGVKYIYLAQLVKTDLAKEGLKVAITSEEILKITKELLKIINSNSNKEMMYFIIDEFSFLIPSKNDSDKIIKQEIINNISLILRICRSENIRIILTTQKCHSDFLPTSISSLLENKLTFRCADNASSVNVIGVGEAVSLNKREFILVDNNGMNRGKTYTSIL